MSFKCSRQFVCLQMQNQLLLRWLTLKHGRKSKATFTKIVLRVLGKLGVQKLRNFRESDVHDRLAPENGAFFGSQSLQNYVKLIVTSSSVHDRLVAEKGAFLRSILFKITWNWSWLRQQLVPHILWAKCSWNLFKNSWNSACFGGGKRCVLWFNSLRNYIKLIMTSSTVGPSRTVG